MKIFDIEEDNVIDGVVATGCLTYEMALKSLVPLINKTEFQRRLQDKKFYQKLERDIESGCVMPPITVAFVSAKEAFPQSIETFQDYIATNINEAFVLDGIQRLSTLERLSDSLILNKEKRIYVNFIICDSVDKLLYRMITLNNGQRPMTPRHQVEAMAANLSIFDKYGIVCKSEKDDETLQSSNRPFNKADLVQAYLAFMANSPLVDNKKIIQEKMDELIVNKIITSGSEADALQFDVVLQCLAKFKENDFAYKWLSLTNNLVGFAVGLRKSGIFVLSLSVEEFVRQLEVFDSVFSQFDFSKIKLGKYRRELSCEFFRHIEKFMHNNVDEVLEHFASMTDE